MLLNYKVLAVLVGKNGRISNTAVPEMVMTSIHFSEIITLNSVLEKCHFLEYYY